MKKSKGLGKPIKVAKTEKPPALYRLGIGHQLGRQLPQDMEKACYLITKAAELGHAEAVE